MGSHRLFEHTADMGIEASGDDLEDLFVHSALGLREMIFGESRAEPLEVRSVEISGDAEGELLVNWLNEILFLYETRGFFPDEFSIAEMKEGHLRGTIRGESFDPDRHGVEREVKAVTYHQLQVEKTDNGWHTRILVDL